MKNKNLIRIILFTFTLLLGGIFQESVHSQSQKETKTDSVLEKNLVKNKLFTKKIGIRFESMPYAPIFGQTIGPNAVVIGTASLQYKSNTSLVYWKSADWLTGEGSYDAFFLTHMLPIGSENIKLQAIHLADFTFKDKGILVLSVGLSGDFYGIAYNSDYLRVFYKKDSPAWIMRNSLEKFGFKLTSWVYYENGNVTNTLGINFTSDSQKIPGIKGVTYNSFAQFNRHFNRHVKNVVSIGLNFTL